MSSKPFKRNYRWPFLMTPAQHRTSAAQLRASGQLELAQQCENLAKAIEKRRTGNEPLAPLK
jgi:hypothetical protein